MVFRYPSVSIPIDIIHGTGLETAHVRRISSLILCAFGGKLQLNLARNNNVLARERFYGKSETFIQCQQWSYCYCC